MRIIGIHDGHNASVCLLEDGKITAALQEERITRIKNDFTFPTNALKRILEITKLSVNDIDKFVFASNHIPYSQTKAEMLKSYKDSEGKSVKVYVKNSLRHTFAYKNYLKRRRESRVKAALLLGINEKKISFVEHHLCHAAAAYWGSDFNKSDKTLILTADGGGDGLCATVSIAKKNKISRIAKIDWSDSIGGIYAKVTYLLGMVPNEHEYKLMGMSPYGDEKGAKLIYEKLNSWFTINHNSIIWSKAEHVPHTFYSYEFLKKEFERMRFDWIARGLQDWIEDILCKWVSNCISLTGIHNVVLGGGVFMNVKANKRISELKEVDKLFIFPSCGDETNAVGAAFATYANEKNSTDIEPVDHVYWGPEYDDKQILKSIERYNFENCSISYEQKENIETEVANLLSKNEIVARFSGKEEFGARSLGNRAILANPSNTELIKEINEMIKNRDFWMPFACSIKEDRSTDYLINPKNLKSQFMILSFDTTDKVKEIKAGTHPYDKSVRPQIVEEITNKNYFKLITEFEKLTSIGGILNTSFNLHGLPIVSSPEDALYVLDHSGLNYLAIGNYLIKKN
jgi:carbamoyltransferase